MMGLATRACASVSIGLLVSLAANGSSPASSKDALSVDDREKISTLSDLALSPDGKLAAIVVSRPDYSSNRRQRSLVLVDTGTGSQRVVTSGDVAAPAFSPQNNALAWLAPGADGTVQVVALPLEPAKEASRALMSAFPGAGVQQFAWNPSGTAIAYLAPEEPLARTGSSRFDHTFQVAESDYLGTSYLARNGGAAPARIWVLPASGGNARMMPAP